MIIDIKNTHIDNSNKFNIQILKNCSKLEFQANFLSSNANSIFD